MIFWGIKYEPLLEPLSLKFVSGAPGVSLNKYGLCLQVVVFELILISAYIFVGNLFRFGILLSGTQASIFYE